MNLVLRKERRLSEFQSARKNIKFQFTSSIHWCPKLKLHPVSSFSSFEHNSPINEHKNMKLKENICFEIIN